MVREHTQPTTKIKISSVRSRTQELLKCETRLVTMHRAPIKIYPPNGVLCNQGPADDDNPHSLEGAPDEDHGFAVCLVADQTCDDASRLDKYLPPNGVLCNQGQSAQMIIHTAWRARLMKTMVLPVVLLLALSVPALAGNDKGNQGNGNGNGGNVRGAPGPLVGAGLPVLLIGGGIYWLIRRKKRAI